MTKSYGILGIFLTLIGLGALAANYFFYPSLQSQVASVPLTAVSLLAVILGLTSIFLAISKPSPDRNQPTRSVGVPLLILTLMLAIINAILILLKQNDIAIYFILDSIAYIVITLFYTSLNHRSVSALNRMSAIIFVGFITIMVFKIMVILK